MNLFSCFLILSLSFASSVFSANKHQEKSSWTEKKIQGAKNKAHKKLKKKKAKLKKKINLTSNMSSEQKLEYLCFLQRRYQEGSVDAIYEASNLFGVSNIYALDEAIDTYICDLYEKNSFEDIAIELCGKYIGDDGLEYDDGLEDEIVEELSFYSLPIHQWEKKIIEKIVSSLAEKTLAQLLLDRKEMEKRGDQIRHVHPLRFMGYVFHDPYLKACLPQFKNSAFKWSNFIDGFVQKMREEMAKGNVVKHLEGFCDYLKVDLEKVSELVNSGQFEDLIYFLMDA